MEATTDFHRAGSAQFRVIRPTLTPPNPKGPRTLGFWGPDAMNIIIYIYIYIVFGPYSPIIGSLEFQDKNPPENKTVWNLC